MTVIRNATLVLPSGLQRADVEFGNGKIKRIAKGIRAPSSETINAAGKHVLPGLIDSHVHLRDFSESSKEDWLSGTSAALAGGVTTVLEMPNSALPTTSIKALHSKLLVAKGKALCDYGFHFGGTQNNEAEARQVQKLQFVASLKLFLASSTGNLLVDEFAPLYSHLLSWKKPVAVHAEDNGVIRYFYKKRLLGRKGRLTAADHSFIRNALSAELSLSRALVLARTAKSRLHVCHVTTSCELELIRQARGAGQQISSEVTPHHLFLSENSTKKLGNLAKVNPPLRSKHDVAALWRALDSGEITMVSSDHAPHTLEEKEQPYTEAPSGVPGLETTLPLLLDAVARNKLSLQQVALLCSRNPARAFGIKGKGEIRAGMDADLVLVDLGKETTIRGENLFTKCRWSPFEGMTLKGGIEKVFLRGEESYNGESILARTGRALPIAVGR